MSADGSSSEKDIGTPSRPKFSWDLKSAPWTDGRGTQEEFPDAVERWCDFHDLLEEKNPNKISPRLRGVMLWSQLSGRGRDCARKIPKAVLMSEHGAHAILFAIYRHYPLFIVSSVFNGFTALVSARRANNESLRAFEVRFEAAVSRFQAHGSEISIPEPLLALMLLNNARVEDNQLASILASSVNSIPDASAVDPSSIASSSSSPSDATS